MTVLEIMQEIKSAGLENDILRLLVLDRIETLEKKQDDLVEANATLRLISKVTKDKTVKDILSED